MHKVSFEKRNYQTQCSLGEGLYFKEGSLGFVDINKNQIFIISENDIVSYEVDNKPSVIFDIKQKILFGSESGIVSLDPVTQHERLITSFKEQHSFCDYRSNDGVMSDDLILLSFMHREKSDSIEGRIYSIKENTIRLIDDELFIPNSFVNIGENNFLISDSLLGQIWKFEFNSRGELDNKSLWYENKDNFTPDGACVVGDEILFAMWDKSCLSAFSFKGEHLRDLKVPFKRPSNCKYNDSTKEIAITSAREGMSNLDLEEYPFSGNTLVFNMDSL